MGRAGKLTVCYGDAPCLIGKSTIPMAIVNSYDALAMLVYHREVSQLRVLRGKVKVGKDSVRKHDEIAQ